MKNIMTLEQALRNAGIDTSKYNVKLELNPVKETKELPALDFNKVSNKDRFEFKIMVDMIRALTNYHYNSKKDKWQKGWTGFFNANFNSEAAEIKFFDKLDKLMKRDFRYSSMQSAVEILCREYNLLNNSRTKYGEVDLIVTDSREYLKVEMNIAKNVFCSSAFKDALAGFYSYITFNELWNEGLISTEKLVTIGDYASLAKNGQSWKLKNMLIDVLKKYEIVE